MSNLPLLQQTVDIFIRALTIETYFIDNFNLLMGGFLGLFTPLLVMAIYTVYNCVICVMQARGAKVEPFKYQKLMVFFSIGLLFCAIGFSVILVKYEYLYTDNSTQKYLTEQLEPRHMDIPLVAELYSKPMFSRYDIASTLIQLQRIKRVLIENSDEKNQSDKEIAIQNLNRLKTNY